MNTSSRPPESDAEVFARFRALPIEERQRLSPLLMSRSYRHWQTWVGFVICIAGMIIGSALGKQSLTPYLGVFASGVVGGALGGALGGLLLGLIQRPIQARHLRELMAESPASSATDHRTPDV